MSMTITEVGRKYDLSVDTLRYYERIGLLPPVHRTPSGLRDYDEDDLRWVEFIKCMRSAGVSIETLVEYVTLFHKGSDTIAARKALLIEQRQQIQAHIEELQTVIARLDRKLDGYEGRMAQCEGALKKLPD